MALQLVSPATSAVSDRPRFTTTTPVVSVVMCTYNGEKYLRPAIESILNQTFREFEFIVVDDGSTDSTPQILAEFQDERLVVVRNDPNRGIAAATNRALSLARGEYIALQDHDDISLPHRLQTQVEYLRTHADIGLISSAVTLIDSNGAPYSQYVEPYDDFELKWEVLSRCPVSHTSVMVRRSVMQDVGGYSADPSLKYASDYDLLSRIILRQHVAILGESLVQWRRHPTATMIKHEEQLRRGIEAVSLRNIGLVANSRIDFDPGSTLNGARDAVAAEDCGLKSPECDPDQQYLYLGYRAFAATPEGEIPALRPEQVIAGLRFVCDIQEIFCRTYRPSSLAASRLRKRLNWAWGKHAVALAIRAPWDWYSRARMFMLGIQRLQSAAWAVLWRTNWLAREV
jgi:hypothetical protein